MSATVEGNDPRSRGIPSRRLPAQARAPRCLPKSNCRHSISADECTAESPNPPPMDRWGRSLQTRLPALPRRKIPVVRLRDGLPNAERRSGTLLFQLQPLIQLIACEWQQTGNQLADARIHCRLSKRGTFLTRNCYVQKQSECAICIPVKNHPHNFSVKFSRLLGSSMIHQFHQISHRYVVNCFETDLPH